MWLFKSSGSNFSKTYKGIDRQQVCKGCSRIEILLDKSQRDKSPPSGRLPFHTDFAELDQCARHCETCRIFRQALLLKCATTSEADHLLNSTNGCTVYARLQDASEPLDRFQLTIEVRDFPQHSARVRCCSGMESNLNLPENPISPHVLLQAQQWVNNCHRTHKEVCPSLRWSSANPTRLVRILSESELQICEPGAQDVQYVALSYSWGTQTLSKEEFVQLERGKTTSQNLASRRHSFLIADLPSTLQDAITLCRRMEIFHLWIDSLCIIQNESDRADFEREAPKMHQYYGNAHFTLAVCSNVKATHPLLVPRTAFTHSTHPSRLGGLWLSTVDIPMTDMLSNSPLAKRAWTLQEQCLSPRVLYWTPNRMYWSCAQTQAVESISTGADSVVVDQSQMLTNSPQTFLLECNRGTSESRHREWLSVIESYSLRDMSDPKDRFAALSALAARYRSSFNVDQEYLAGLWKSSFAQDLSWVVMAPASSSPADKKGPPSWTWASLPLCTGICITRDVTQSEAFNLIGIDIPITAGAELKDTDPVLRGALVRAVCVRARLRAFWTDTATFQPWQAVISATRQGNDTTIPLTHTFSFSQAPETSVFSADPVTGKVVAYEARKQEVVGQLDYTNYAAMMCDGWMSISAMEIARNSMLLLEGLDDGSFRRVGMVTSYRPDFFEGVDEEEVTLG